MVGALRQQHPPIAIALKVIDAVHFRINEDDMLKRGNLSVAGKLFATIVDGG